RGASAGGRPGGGGWPGPRAPGARRNASARPAAAVVRRTLPLATPPFAALEPRRRIPPERDSVDLILSLPFAVFAVLPWNALRPRNSSGPRSEWPAECHDSTREFQTSTWDLGRSDIG